MPMAGRITAEVKAYIEEKGGVFHLGPIGDRSALEKGRIHSSTSRT